MELRTGATASGRRLDAAAQHSCCNAALPLAWHVEHSGYIPRNVRTRVHFVARERTWLNTANAPVTVETRNEHLIRATRRVPSELSGGQEVAGSNPVTPTIIKPG